jgi:UDP-N-acetylmuramoyl-tripeptide--D-alanyl-D-alanine ligase
MQIHLLGSFGQGASYAIIDNEFYIDERTIMVQDSLMALQELKFHRAYLKLPIIALTGSNRKTTTKSLFRLYCQKNTILKLQVTLTIIGVPFFIIIYF